MMPSVVSCPTRFLRAARSVATVREAIPSLSLAAWLSDKPLKNLVHQLVRGITHREDRPNQITSAWDRSRTPGRSRRISTHSPCNSDYLARLPDGHCGCDSREAPHRGVTECRLGRVGRAHCRPPPPPAPTGELVARPPLGTIAFLLEPARHGRAQWRQRTYRVSEGLES
jgi:hypothetical protein